jgi:hypothetical protein
MSLLQSAAADYPMVQAADPTCTAASSAAKTGSSIAARLVVLVLAVSLPLLGFAAYLIHGNAASIRQLTVLSALGIARNVAAATDEFLRTAHTVLPHLAHRIVTTQDGKAVCDPLIREFHTLMPQFLNLIVVDRQGHLACSALPADQRRFRPSGKDAWFETTLRDHENMLTGPRRGQITGKWISTYSYPKIEPDGDVSAVIAIALDLARFQPVIRQA